MFKYRATSFVNNKDGFGLISPHRIYWSPPGDILRRWKKWNNMLFNMLRSRKPCETFNGLLTINVWCMWCSDLHIKCTICFVYFASLAFYILQNNSHWLVNYHFFKLQINFLMYFSEMWKGVQTWRAGYLLHSSLWFW